MTPSIQIINKDFNEMTREIDLLADLHHNTEVILTDENGAEINKVTYGLLRQANLRSHCMELTPKGYGILTNKDGSKIVTEEQYFGNLKLEQKRRVMKTINDAVEKYMTENNLKVPDALIVSKKIYDCLEQVAILVTGLYSLTVELDEQLAAAEFKLRPHVEDAEEV